MRRKWWHSGALMGLLPSMEALLRALTVSCSTTALTPMTPMLSCVPPWGCTTPRSCARGGKPWQFPQPPPQHQSLRLSVRGCVCGCHVRPLQCHGALFVFVFAMLCAMHLVVCACCGPEARGCVQRECCCENCVLRRPAVRSVSVRSKVLSSSSWSGRLQSIFSTTRLWAAVVPCHVIGRATDPFGEVGFAL